MGSEMCIRDRYKNSGVGGANSYGNIATSFSSNIVNNDIIMLAMDRDNGKFWFGVNGTWDNSGNPATGNNAMPVNDNPVAGQFFAFYFGGENNEIQCNFGNPPYAVSSSNNDGKYGNFEYAPPSGYYALCTKRLAEFG